MARRPKITEREELAENVQIVRALLERAKWWAVPENATAYVAKREQQIAALQREIADARTKFAEAPKTVASLSKALGRTLNKLRRCEDRGRLNKLESLAKRARELQAIVDARRAALAARQSK